MSDELDGLYRVRTTTDYQGPFPKQSDGETIIKNGKTNRTDKVGCKWTSTFTVLNENEVEMVSIADPSEADINFLLTKPDGTPTAEPVTYRAVLNLARKGDQIQMSGKIDYSSDVVFITMRKIGEAP